MYDWYTDYPISLQQTTSQGMTVFRLEFELTASEIEAFRTEVESSLNGTLPIEMRIGKSGSPSFKVVKRGPGGKHLSKKADRIAAFIGKRIDFNYIPTIRTAESALSVVMEMVDRRLRRLEDQPSYVQALEQIQQLQQPLLDKISDEVTETLRQFLPDVNGVNITLSSPQSRRFNRRDIDFIVDDGVPTSLERKGDGIKSLAAISLLHGSGPQDGASILALEEPESHLHPKAIHVLNSILSELSANIQLVITTHNPLFVNRGDLSRNVIVLEQSAIPARSLDQIREILGIQVSDNLASARLVLLVEGSTDKKILETYFESSCSTVSDAITKGELAIEVLDGASKLPYKVSLVTAALCLPHALLDNDAESQNAITECLEREHISEADYHLTICPGLNESEIEDLVNQNIYAGEIQKQFGVSLRHRSFRTKAKWSDRMAAVFRAQGKMWNKSTKMKAKAIVCDAVISAEGSVFHAERSSSMESLNSALVDKLSNVK